jgi:N-methylhydantoinase B
MRAVVHRFEWMPGDVVICNDPYVGGTHLPDVSLVSPVFGPGGDLVGFVANRAHHADIGGAFPGSMAPTSEVFQEGLIIPPLKLVAAGVTNEPLLELLFRNVRTPQERRGDLRAQLAANTTGRVRLEQLVARYGSGEFQRRAEAAREKTRVAVRALLRELPAGTWSFTDYLEDDGCGGGEAAICVAVSVVDGRLIADFTGTASQQKGSINATLAVTHSAVYYALSCLLAPEIWLNEGVFDAVSVRAPEGTLVNAVSPAAVAAGNVETSQRMVDVLFGALAQALPGRIPAASQGTMNNITLGGTEPAPWAYYETMGGGAGAAQGCSGASGIHCHMSNTRNTPAETMEYHYPLRILRYALHEASGGAGEWSGGKGLVREIQFLAPARLTLLTERRSRTPYGLAGGDPGMVGRNETSVDGVWSDASPKASVELPAESHLRISTPGGGGWGDVAKAER